MSLSSKYNRIKEFSKLLTKSKALKPENLKTQLKKERYMKNVDDRYKNYYNAYKNDYGAADELNEAKKKEFNYKRFEWFDKTDEHSKLDGETKFF